MGRRDTTEEGGGGRRKSEEDVGWRRQSKVRSLCRWEI